MRQASVKPFQFSRPVRQIISMLLALGLGIAATVIALPRILPIFEANPWLNGFILMVFFIGVLACFWQMIQLLVAIRWIERFAGGVSVLRSRGAPPILASLATLLGERDASARISPSSARSILDSVATRIDEAREITRYIASLLIFLGLLGTFYGLATTVPAIVQTIQSLTPQEGEDTILLFGRLMDGLEEQLAGMGVAFASSLLGLAGSLLVGLLELFVSHGQNRFFRELEEWISSITSIALSEEMQAAAYGSEELDGSSERDRLVALALTQLISQIETMGEQIRLLDEGRREEGAGIMRMSDALNRFSDTQRDLPETLNALRGTTERLSAELMQDKGGHSIGGSSLEDEGEIRMRLRSIDAQLLRIAEELRLSRRNEATQEQGPRDGNLPWG